MTPDPNTVVLLDDVRHEGILSTIAASDIEVIHVPLGDLASWERVLPLIDDDRVIAFVGKLSVSALINLGLQGRDAQNREVITQLKRKPHMLFLHNDLYSGELLEKAEATGKAIVAPHSSVDADVIVSGTRVPLYQLPALRRGIRHLREISPTILVYRTSAEVTVAAETFIVETESGLLFRLYIPAGKIFEREIERMVSLFSDFLTKVAQLNVRVDNVKTTYGAIYAFHGQGLTPDETAAKFEEFTTFVDLCATDPDAAGEALSHYGLTRREVIVLVERYSKEARRINIDLKHERELKLLAVRQRFETEVTELAPVSPGTLARLADAVVPQAPSFGFAPLARESALATPLGVNIGSISIGQIQHVVASEVSGKIVFGLQDQELLTLFEAHAGAQRQILTSALYELKDDSAPIGNRATARQRIRTFLLNVASKLESVALATLQAYVEHTLGL